MSTTKTKPTTFRGKLGPMRKPAKWWPAKRFRTEEGFYRIESGSRIAEINLDSSQALLSRISPKTLTWRDINPENGAILVDVTGEFLDAFNAFLREART